MERDKEVNDEILVSRDKSSAVSAEKGLPIISVKTEGVQKYGYVSPIKYGTVSVVWVALSLPKCCIKNVPQFSAWTNSTKRFFGQGR